MKLTKKQRDAQERAYAQQMADIEAREQLELEREEERDRPAAHPFRHVPALSGPTEYAPLKWPDGTIVEASTARDD